MASLLDALLGRPAQSIDELNGSKLGQIAQRFKYANNPVGTETNHQIGLGPVDRLMEVAQSPQVQNMVQIGSGMGDGGGVGMIRAYHGSPHMFDRFDLSKIGTGEGAQAYGHGLYFAGNEGVARGYRDALAPVRVIDQGGRPVLDAWTPIAKAAQDAGAQFGAPLVQANKIADQVHRGLMDGDSLAHMRKFVAQSDWEPAERAMWEASLKTAEPWAAQRNGHMYEVNINAEPGQLLDWDKPLAQQPAGVRDVLRQIAPNIEAMNGREGMRNIPLPNGGIMPPPPPTLPPLGGRAIGELYPAIERTLGAPTASQTLRDAGIPGIQYLDAGSRGAGEGSRNYVIFDDKLIDILRRYAFPGMVATGAMAAVPGESQ